jgi:hypothetical protein
MIKPTVLFHPGLNGMLGVSNADLSTLAGMLYTPGIFKPSLDLLLCLDITQLTQKKVGPTEGNKPTNVISSLGVSTIFSGRLTA